MPLTQRRNRPNRRARRFVSPAIQPLVGGVAEFSESLATVIDVTFEQDMNLTGTIEVLTLTTALGLVTPAPTVTQTASNRIRLTYGSSVSAAAKAVVIMPNQMNLRSNSGGFASSVPMVALPAA